MKCFQQSFSLYESGSDLTCLWRTCLTLLPLLQNIQILHLQSQCQCLFFTVLLCGRKRRCDDGGWRRVEGLFSRTPYVVSFGGLLVSVYAWQVLAPFLCSWCLCTRLCHHPPAPLPLDLAQHNVSPPRQHEHKMKSKLN